MARRRQRELIRVAGVQRIGSGHHIEQQRKVGGAARHRPDHREVAVERQRRKRRRRMPARGRQRKGRLVGIDAAMKRRHPQRAADIGAERQRSVTRRQRCRGSAGRAAGGTAEVERIVGGAVDLVVALPVAEPERHVGLAEDHAAGGLDPGYRQRVFRRHEILLRRIAPSRGQSRDVVGFLDGYGNAKQRAGFAAGASRVGGAGGFQAAVEIANANRVDLAVVTLDAADRILRQFDGREFLCRKSGR